MTPPDDDGGGDGGDGSGGSGGTGESGTGESGSGDGGGCGAGGCGEGGSGSGEGEGGTGGRPAQSLADVGGWPADEEVARWWQEGFTEGADAEYTEQILPMAAAHLAGARRVLDLGCGEGQVARLAASLSPPPALVVGVDPTWAQLRVAARRAGGPRYAGAAAAELPFPAAAFDAVVACLVFEHVDEVDAALSEVGRVLVAGGRLLLFLNHPLLQVPGSGWIDDQVLDPPEQYWRIGPYLVEDKSLEEVEKGIFIPFVHRPLSRYVNGLAAQGLLVTRMDEPAPPPGFLARAEEYAEAATIPRLLFLRAEKLR